MPAGKSLATLVIPGRFLTSAIIVFTSLPCEKFFNPMRKSQSAPGLLAGIFSNVSVNEFDFSTRAKLEQSWSRLWTATCTPVYGSSLWLLLCPILCVSWIYFGIKVDFERFMAF